MVAVPLIYGRLTAAHYEDGVAADPRIDALREKWSASRTRGFSRDYLDPRKRSIANAITVVFDDGSTTPESWSNTRSATAGGAGKAPRS